MDAYLEEELYDLLTSCIKNKDLLGRGRIVEIGKELAADGGSDAMESMFFSIENRIKDETGASAQPHRSWWNGITDGWKY
jgi:hypothetical protein